MDKETIYNFIRERQAVSFVELSKIDGVKGDLAMCLPHKNKEYVFWNGLSQEIISVLLALRREGRIFMKPCSFLVYHVDGGIMVRKKNITGCNQWLPVTLWATVTEKQQSQARKWVESGKGTTARTLEKMANELVAKIPIDVFTLREAENGNG